MTKATHQGTCQCCGAVQKLPEGVLAKHGYTTRWGFFSGVCSGSGHRPFETHCDLVERFILSAKNSLRDTIEFQRKLKEEAPTTPTCWMRVYNPRLGSYGWHEVVLSVSEHGATLFANPHTKQTERVPFYGFDLHRTEGLLGWAHEANKRRAAALTTDIGGLESYIRWQEHRLATWTEQPLQPVPPEPPPSDKPARRRRRSRFL